MIKLERLDIMSNNHKDKDLKVFQNAVIQNGIANASLNMESVVNTQHVFSENIETGKVANQKSSGRCWIFAALNTFRHKMNKEYNLQDFQLSQTYTFFWDKLEKSNYFLENVIKTIDKDLDDRLVRFLLTTPQQDGGQWDMLTALIKKYGVVPRSSMPEAFHSTNSAKLNDLLNKKLRIDAEELRNAYSSGKTIEELKEMQVTMIDEIYSFLSVVLGEPPKTIDFEIYTKANKEGNKEFIREMGITPLDFFNKYVNMNLDDYISVINATTEDKPFYKSFTVDFLGNVVGAPEVKYINVPMQEFKEMTIAQIKSGETVWFGCDVGQSSDRVHGIMDINLYEVEKAFKMNFSTSKASTLDYSESLMTHAMVLSGVNIVDGKSNRWKVENSWGEDTGDKGYYVMTDEWMDRYTYQVVINKKFVPEKLQKIYEEEPIRLKPWDPMGSLARTK